MIDLLFSSSNCQMTILSILILWSSIQITNFSYFRLFFFLQWVPYIESRRRLQWCTERRDGFCVYAPECRDIHTAYSWLWLESRQGWSLCMLIVWSMHQGTYRHQAWDIMINVTSHWILLWGHFAPKKHTGCSVFCELTSDPQKQCIFSMALTTSRYGTGKCTTDLILKTTLWKNYSKMRSDILFSRI